MTTKRQNRENDIKRQFVIERARERYIATGITKNITEALKLYLENDAAADEQVPLFITTPEKHQLREILRLGRPRCDECDGELQMQVAAMSANGEKFPTAWNCKNCGMIYYSDKTLKEWLKELQDETRKQNLRNPDKSNGKNVPVGRAASEI